MPLFGTPGAKKTPQFQRKTAFKVFSTVNLVPSGAGTIVDFNSVTYDLGSNFDLVNNRYTIPYQGLFQYAFYFVMQFTAGGASKSVSAELISQFGVEFIIFNHTYKGYQNLDVQSIQGAGSHVFSKDDQVQLKVYATEATLVGSEVSYYFTMYRIENESRTVLGG